MSIVVASAPTPWPREDVKETWKIEEEPNGKQRIWIINKGRIMWNPPEKNECITFEERPFPDEHPDSLMKK
eukprot:12929938-Prorocentrum_lima.AAC.1